MKKILEIILANYARLTLILHKPKIIGITGSVGKTSTKDAIALVLAQKFRVGSSSGNLNSRLGLPLAILGFTKPGGFKRNFSTFFEWLWIIIIGLFRVFRFNYPEILVLEMGSDKPGDIAELLRIVKKLHVAVITDIGISHMEFFGSESALAEEKLSILKSLDKTGFAILNADNPKVLSGKDKTQAKVITFGYDPKLASSDVVGKPAVYALSAAMAVGQDFGLNQQEVSQALKKYQSPAGRLRLIEGQNNTKIIDDSYNAAPSSTMAAIDALLSLPSTRKLAAIGQMAELGSMSETGHREVGLKIFESGLDVVFLVGDKTKLIVDELNTRDFQGRIFWFADSEQAKATIKNNLSAGDAILVKGSQSARMEKIVKEIMAHPDQAEKLLVRQGSQWL